ncbi:unnamed protein product, partial [Meganyctiphanes norvegica]
VNPNNCSCNCPAGQDGSICKHLVGVHLHTDATLFTFPPVTLEERNKYHQIAFGKPPPPYYYGSLPNMDKLPSTSDPATLDPAIFNSHDIQMPDQPVSCTENNSSPNISKTSLDDTLKEDVEAMLAAFGSGPQSEGQTKL